MHASAMTAMTARERSRRAWLARSSSAAIETIDARAGTRSLSLSLSLSFNSFFLPKFLAQNYRSYACIAYSLVSLVRNNDRCETRRSAEIRERQSRNLQIFPIRAACVTYTTHLRNLYGSYYARIHTMRNASAASREPIVSTTKRSRDLGFTVQVSLSLPFFFTSSCFC